MRILTLFSVCVVLSLSAATARGQITFLGDPQFSLDDVALFGGAYRLNNDISSLQVSSTDDGFRITGDATIYLDRSLPAPLDEYHPLVNIRASRAFEVGPLPVRIQGSLVENYEVVIGNGSVTSPSVRNETYVRFDLNDPHVGFATVPNTFLQGTSYDSSEQIGNGVRIFNTDDSGGDYILAPGFRYTVNYFLGGYINSTGVQPNDPTPAVTFEFGGVSNFEGMDISVHSELVPEPATALLATIGGVALFGVARRRRRS